ncbi:MAG TPA: Lrp/AsnC ligand binding domain-containing protein [Gammaproteobacteria bacterium]|nr:Lrp/AsnC ligand binding domain-containing protein [Gammaproteobacteria bacterium]
MVTAIVLVNTERGWVNEVAQELAAMGAISEVYSVGGRFDLVAMIRAASNEELADLVTNHLQHLQGIRDTETLIAFRAYSRHDLETMFSIGLDQ